MTFILLLFFSYFFTIFYDSDDLVILRSSFRQGAEGQRSKLRIFETWVVKVKRILSCMPLLFELGLCPTWQMLCDVRGYSAKKTASYVCTRSEVSRVFNKILNITRQQEWCPWIIVQVLSLILPSQFTQKTTTWTITEQRKLYFLYLHPWFP